MQLTRDTLSENSHQRSITVLEVHLAKAVDLHFRLKQASWSASRLGLTAIHVRLETVLDAMANYSNLIARRICGLGGTVRCSLQTADDHAFLEPGPEYRGRTDQPVISISQALAGFGQSTRDASHQATDDIDATTGGLFAEISHGVAQQIFLINSPFIDSAGNDVSEAIITLNGPRPSEPYLHDRIDIWVNEGGGDPNGCRRTITE